MLFDDFTSIDDVYAVGQAFERGGALTQQRAGNGIYAGRSLGGTVGCGHADACGGAIVVGVARYVGLIELDTVGPLLGGALDPVDEVARPVAGGGARNHEPQVLNVGRCLKGGYVRRVGIGGGGDGRINACTIFEQGHEAVLPACLGTF